MREEENKRSSKSEESPLKMKRLLRKRWLLPALYLIAAAGILSSVFLMQGQDELSAPKDGVEVTESEHGTAMDPYGENAVEVTTSQEVVKMPVEEESDVSIIGHFYDVNASAEEQQEALVYYNNTYYPNKGIDLAQVEGESFNATAALSGTIEKAEKDALLGYVVEINHDNGVVTHYHSLASIEVEEGATVKQGDVLGQAGRNIYNEEAGVHIHFEVRQNGVPVNPNDVLEQPIDSIKDLAGKKEEEKPAEGEEGQEGATDEEQAPEEGQEGATDEEQAPKDDQEAAPEKEQAPKEDAPEEGATEQS
ncbi:M23 family metallopeptidase [Halalkalibacter nanhaiisediminis]|uniref:Stage II sporulation protein Q n=1 Tax=Halalkalibacter nanhaiisediminis TaxID=688079 RepID=A0A562QU82_9BACI|nr:M23 family metallopeptidase [Halalkalibacter nanhaiisediminis]TWI59800.1 stage II sporulation protein Q [Halalkalibacter nanhaiisediminis]